MACDCGKIRIAGVGGREAAQNANGSQNCEKRKRSEVVKASKMASQDDYGSDGERVMRCGETKKEGWFFTKAYLQGPTKTDALKIAHVLEAAGEGKQDTFAYEGALMLAMAGKTAEAKMMVMGLPQKKERDQVVRTKPHIAIGPVYTKWNEAQMAKTVMVKAGGNPGDNWEQVVAVVYFVFEVVKALTRWQPKMLTEAEGVKWVQRMQKAQQGLLGPTGTVETGAEVEVAWDNFCQHVQPTKKRAAAVATEASQAFVAVDQDLSEPEDNRGLMKRALDFLSPGSDTKPAAKKRHRRH